MRAGARAATIIAACLATAVASSPAHASISEVELLLRLGYVIGGGWSVGVGLGVFRAGIPGDFLVRKQFAIFGGLNASADVVVGRAGQADFRVRVGPELGGINTCPSLGGSFTGGPVWVFRRGAPTRLGVDAAGTLLLELYGNNGGPRPWLIGLGYRYALVTGEQSHEIGLEGRLWTLPFDLPLPVWSGFCGPYKQLPFFHGSLAAGAVAASQ
jgi:hypothetical protein